MHHRPAERHRLVATDSLVYHQHTPAGTHRHGRIGSHQSVRCGCLRADIDDRSIESRPRSAGVIGDSDSDALVVAMRPVQFARGDAIAGVSHVVEVILATDAEEGRVVRAEAIPKWLAARRERNVGEFKGALWRV